MNGSRSRDDWTTLLGVPLDAVLAVAWLGLASATVLLPPGTSVRLFATLVTLLVLPGYALTTALFPAIRPPRDRDSLLRPGSGGITPSSIDRGTDVAAVTGVERAALSFGLSVASLPLLGLVIQVTFGEFALQPLLITLAAFVLIALGVGVVRRNRTPAAARYELPVHRWLSGLCSAVSRTKGIDRALNVTLVLAVLASMGTMTFALAAPQDGSQFTEASLLAAQEDGEFAAKNYPTEFQRGESEPLALEVTNREGRSVDYTVVVALQRIGSDDTVVEQARLNRFHRQVDAGESWRKPHEVTPTMVGDRLRLTYLVYDGQSPAEPSTGNAYRTLSIQIDVTEE